MQSRDIPKAAVALEAERALIHAALVDESVLDMVVLPPEAFYDADHARIWRAMQAIHATGEGYVDVVAVAIEAGIPAERLREILGDEPPYALAAPQYAEAIRRAWQVRRASEALSRAAARILNGEADPLESLIGLSQQAQEWAAESGLGEPFTVEEASEALAQRLRDMGKGDSPAFGISLDPRSQEELMNVAAGELHLIAAATGVGKSVMALQIALATAFWAPTLVYTLEMTAEEYVGRLWVMLGAATPRQVRFGGAPPNAVEVVRQHLHEMRLKGRKALYIRHDAFSQEKLLADIRLNARTRGVRVFVVDYLGLVELPAMSLKEKRYRALEDLTTALKRLAAELGVVIIALHQLNRLAEVEKGAGLGAWGDSYGMVRPADGAYLLIRKRGEEEALWRREKVRHGAVGEIRLRFNEALLRFEM